MGRNALCRRRGNVLVLIGVLLVVLLSMAAFAIDVGFIVHARTELQRTADACALAAAARLPDEQAAWVAAEQRAQENRGTVGPTLARRHVEFGYWDRAAARFNSPPPGDESVNAVRVRLERTEESGSPLRLFFGGLLGRPTADTFATATAMVDQQLCGPFIGVQGVAMAGNATTDSYDSRQGSYSPATARGRGSVCSDGPIQIAGRAMVRGDARAGPGQRVQVTGAARVTGTADSRTEPLNLPRVDVSEAARLNDNRLIPMIRQGNSLLSPVDANGDFLLEGRQTLNLPPGTYYLRNLTIKGQSAIDLSGPTTIVVAGNFERSGNARINVPSQNAAYLQLLMVGGRANLTSASDFYGVIYAPNTEIIMDGGSRLFGAVVGRTLTFTGGSSARYDQALELDWASRRRVALVD